MGPPAPGNVLLRNVADGDIPVFFDHQRDPDANRMAGFPTRDWDAHKAHWTKILRDGTVIARTILVEGRVAGNIVSWEQSGKRQVGYWIGREYWGRGVATNALSAFLGIVTTRPLYAYVAKNNVASIRVLEKCGFVMRAEDPDARRGGDEEFLFQLGAHGSKTKR